MTITNETHPETSTLSVGALTQTRPPKYLLELGAPRIDGNPHTLLPLRYDNATTKHDPRQDVRVLRNDVIARH